MNNKYTFRPYRDGKKGKETHFYQHNEAVSKVEKLRHSGESRNPLLIVKD